MNKFRLRFSTRKLFAVVSILAFGLASWQWTKTYGVEQLRRKYDYVAWECVRTGLIADGVDRTPEQFLNDADTSHYFSNPRAVCPFLITVKTDGSFSGHYALQSNPGIRQTHIWFFGYASDALEDW